MILETEYLDATALVAWLTHHVGEDISSAAYCRLRVRIQQTENSKGNIPVRLCTSKPD